MVYLNGKKLTNNQIGQVVFHPNKSRRLNAAQKAQVREALLLNAGAIVAFLGLVGASIYGATTEDGKKIVANALKQVKSLAGWIKKQLGKGDPVEKSKQLAIKAAAADIPVKGVLLLKDKSKSKSKSKPKSTGRARVVALSSRANFVPRQSNSRTKSGNLKESLRQSVSF